MRSGLNRALFRAIDAVNRAVAHAMALGLAVMVVCTALQVAVRFVLTKFGLLYSVPWTEELARFIMIWIVFMGTAVACRRGQLIALEFLVDATPAAIGRTLRLLVLVISLAFFFMLIWVGWSYVTGNFIERSPVMTIRMSWVYISLPIGAVLMVVNTICLAIDDLSGRPRAPELYAE